MSQKAWESCCAATAPSEQQQLPGTVIGALHASKHKCQLIEFANDTFSQNPSPCTHHFVLAIKLQAKTHKKGGKKKKPCGVI